MQSFPKYNKNSEFIARPLSKSYMQEIQDTTIQAQ